MSGFVDYVFCVIVFYSYYFVSTYIYIYIAVSFIDVKSWWIFERLFQFSTKIKKGQNFATAKVAPHSGTLPKHSGVSAACNPRYENTIRTAVTGTDRYSSRHSNTNVDG